MITMHNSTPCLPVVADEVNHLSLDILRDVFIVRGITVHEGRIPKRREEEEEEEEKKRKKKRV